MTYTFYRAQFPLLLLARSNPSELTLTWCWLASPFWIMQIEQSPEFFTN
jgi:hypothetical protein